MANVMTLRAGLTAVDITPEGPVHPTGFASRIQPSTGVRDPIFCRALALGRDGQRLLLLALDLLNLTPEQDRRFRRSVVCPIGAFDGGLGLANGRLEFDYHFIIDFNSVAGTFSVSERRKGVDHVG